MWFARMKKVDPREMTAAGEICEIFAVGISFTFERNGPIGRIEIPVNQQTDQPFDEIKDIERQEEELALLSSVDALMVDDKAVYPRSVA